MPLRIDCYIQGEEANGPIDLEASLARLRAELERAAGAQATTITLGLSAIFTARQAASGPDWDPDEALGCIWRGGSWVVYAPRDGDNATDWNTYTAREGGEGAPGGTETPGATRGREGV